MILASCLNNLFIPHHLNAKCIIPELPLTMRYYGFQQIKSFAINSKDLGVNIPEHTFPAGTCINQVRP